MTIALPIAVNIPRQTMRIGAALLTGNAYEIAWSGLPQGMDPTLLLIDSEGNGIAASADGLFALTTQAVADDFPAWTRPGFARAYHLYAVYDGATIAQAQVMVRWSQVQFAVDGAPVSLAGPKGDQGDQGHTGNTGPSAYDVAVANGFSGTEPQWLASLVPAIDASPTVGSSNAVASAGTRAMIEWFSDKVPIAGTNQWQPIQYVVIGGKLYLQQVGSPASSHW